MLEKFEGDVLIAFKMGAISIGGVDIDSRSGRHMLTCRHNIRRTRCQLKNNPNTYEPKIIVENKNPKRDVCIIYTYGKKFNYESDFIEYRIAESERDMEIDFINNFHPRNISMFIL